MKQKHYTVRIRPIKKGVRIYYRAEMQLKLFGFTQWAPFTAYKHSGDIYKRVWDESSEDSKRPNKMINNLKYIVGENNVTVL